MKRRSTRHAEPVEINGVRYEPAGDKLQRVLIPGEKTPPDVHVTVPHPDPDLRKKGFRLGWIFLAGTVLACLALAFLAPIIGAL